MIILLDPHMARIKVGAQHQTLHRRMITQLQRTQQMERSDTYRAVLPNPDALHPVTGRTVKPTFSIVANRQAGVMLFSAMSPAALFFTKEPNLSSAFCEYLDGYIKNAAPREETLAKLRQYIIELDEAIGKK